MTAKTQAEAAVMSGSGILGFSHRVLYSGLSQSLLVHELDKIIIIVLFLSTNICPVL